MSPIPLIAQDKSFLTTLDSKLHYVHEGEFTPNVSGDPFPIFTDHYHPVRMEGEEAKKLLRVVQRSRYVLHPVNTSMGFAVGFGVYDRLHKKEVLMFREDQLPEGYSWDTMRRVFMGRKNRLLARLSGIELREDHSHYEY